MTFEPSEIENFRELFENNKDKIRNFDGCRLLELYQDRDTPAVFFTYSYWEDETNLEYYRSSELFKGVWAETKKMFAGKPEAWSVDKLVSLE